MHNLEVTSRQPQGYLKGARHSSGHAFPESQHFDDRLDELFEIAEKLIISKGVFHITLHFSSSQLTCLTYDNPYSYQVYHAEEVFSDHFMRLFAPLSSKLHTCIDRELVKPILGRLKTLRLKGDAGELRNASIHMINGFISLSFACDDTRYINYRDFLKPLDII